MMACSAYFRCARYFGKEKFLCRIIPRKAFYYGIENKSSFRLIGIAVAESEQGNGIGTDLVCELMQKCYGKGLRKITLRTHKSGKAVGFWKTMGAVVTGEKGEDYEMAITL